MTHPTITLTLPLPPAKNQIPNTVYGRHKAATAYKRKAWSAALGQHLPKHPLDLPEKVGVHLTFVSRGATDEDAHVDAKWVLDALKAKQSGKVAWRGGVAREKGYFIDDSPKHMSLVGIRPVRSDNIEPCVVVKITPRET